MQMKIILTQVTDIVTGTMFFKSKQIYWGISTLAMILIPSIVAASAELFRKKLFTSTSEVLKKAFSEFIKHLPILQPCLHIMYLIKLRSSKEGKVNEN